MNMLLIIVAILISSLFMLFLGLWTYRDAKSRGIEAGMWTAIVLLVPNLIGLLLYFLIARRQTNVICPRCGAKTPANAQYCGGCGQQLDAGAAQPAVAPRKNTGLLVGMLICFVVIALIIGLIAAQAVYGDIRNSGFGVSVGKAEHHTSRQWNISYLRSNEEFTNRITKQDGKPDVIYVDASCKKGGTLWFVAEQGANRAQIDISDTQGETPIGLSGFTDGTIVLRLIGDGAENVRFKSHW